MQIYSLFSSEHTSILHHIKTRLYGHWLSPTSQPQLDPQTLGYKNASKSRLRLEKK